MYGGIIEMYWHFSSSSLGPVVLKRATGELTTLENHVCVDYSLVVAVEFSIVKMPVPPIEQYWQNVFFSFLQALDSLRKALGLPNATDPNPHPEMKSLEQQEEELEKTVGAVMQCGRITSTISAGKNKDWSQITIHSTIL